MSKNVNDFSVAKVGDRVWSSLSGEGEISEIHPAKCTFTLPIRVENKNGMPEQTFTFKGEYLKGGPQCLFWSKPEIIAPERPKGLVAKVVKVRPYIDRCDGTLDLTTNVNSDFIARLNAWCGPAKDIEIEVWEE